METELLILFQNKFLSRKQYRELLKDHPKDIDSLGQLLLSLAYLEPPDWVDAQKLLEVKSTDHTNKDEAPDSKNEQVQKIHNTALRIANSDTTILVLGESGVGKSRLAHLIHDNSPRKNGPMVVVSCGSIPDTLLESELFGVVKGAFTGANKTREGRFQRAHGGTIFLDEIGELGPSLQVKLLRVIQEKKIEPLGSSEEVSVDIRLIAATNRNLENDVESGRFRKDLYFRLNVIPVTLPSLEHRPEDILPLATFFIQKFQKQSGRIFSMIDDGLKETLLRYNWPGNIRELENCVERLLVLADKNGDLHIEDLPPRMIPKSLLKKEKFLTTKPTEHLGNENSGNENSMGSLASAHKGLIKKALEKTSGSISNSATLLGIHRNTLRRKLKELKIDPALFKKKRYS